MNHIRPLIWSSYDRLRNNSRACLKELKYWQTQTYEANLVHQNELLSRILSHAAKHVPYYRKMFSQANIKDISKLTSDSIKDLPFLDKDIIRNNFEDLKSTDWQSRKPRVNSSGGSTGQPVKLIQDQNYRNFSAASRLLFDEWSGYHLGMGQAWLWGSERDLLKGNEKLRHRISRWLRNELWLNTYKMNAEDIELYIDKINKFKPKQLLAYAESAYDFALHIKKDKHIVDIPAIMTSAGTLHPHMRKAIEEAFGAPVFNRYGSREVSGLACDCSFHEGLHICMPTHFIEILREDGTPTDYEEPGEVVVTLLTNYAMPLIRYRIGDTAAWKNGACQCGRGWPVLSNVFGRTTDRFKTRNGSVIDGRALGRLIWRNNFVRRYQIIQRTYDHVLFNVVPLANTSIEDPKMVALINQIKFEAKAIMGPNTKIDFNWVDNIPPTASGKYKYLISEINDG